ncbi:VCBS repeat-containing protein [Hymenobacter algoricola]|uniref:FG-GAP repeat domain-containing protein n=1 Tax=Hymenobacter algoricola TaxID=486267 RepID=UPI0031E83DFF
MKYCLFLTFAALLALPGFAQQQNPPISLQASTLALPLGAAPSDVAVADFNHDQRPDLAVTQRGLNQLAIFQQTASGFPATATRTYAAGTSPSSVVAVSLDVNNPNAYLDDLFTVSGPDGHITAFTNSLTQPGALTASLAVNFASTYPSVSPRLQAGNLNGDGLIDLAMTNDREILAGVFAYAHRGNGVVEQIARQTTLDLPANIQLSDLDQDGDLDALVAMPLYNQIRIMQHSIMQAEFWLAPPINIPSLGTGASSAAAGDINLDFYPDLAVANSGSNTVVVFLRTAPLQYTTPLILPMSATPRHVLLADLNGDRAAELIVTTDTQLLVYRNTLLPGPPRFATPVIFPLGPNPDALRLADVNGDRVTDILIPLRRGSYRSDLL